MTSEGPRNRQEKEKYRAVTQRSTRQAEFSYVGAGTTAPDDAPRHRGARKTSGAAPLPATTVLPNRVAQVVAQVKDVPLYTV